jgi:hypothetical protein
VICALFTQRRMLFVEQHNSQQPNSRGNLIRSNLSRSNLNRRSRLLHVVAYVLVDVWDRHMMLLPPSGKYSQYCAFQTSDWIWTSLLGKALEILRAYSVHGQKVCIDYKYLFVVTPQATVQQPRLTFSARSNPGTGISQFSVRMIVKPDAETSTTRDCRVDRFRAELTGRLSSGALSFV